MTVVVSLRLASNSMLNECVFQVPALVTALVTLCLATPPPGYVKKPDNDKVS